MGRLRGGFWTVLGTAVFLIGLLVGARALLGTGALTHVEQDRAVTSMDLSAGTANNSPEVVVDPADERFVAVANRIDAPDFGCALQVSGDSGKSWLSAKPVPSLPPGAEKCYAAEVAFDHSGRLYYLFVGLAGGGNKPMGVFLTTSTDHSRTFSSPWQVLGPLSFGVRMAIDPTMGANGRIQLAWLEATSEPSLGGLPPTANPIVSAHSDDGGHTFSAPVQVSDQSRARSVAPALTLGPDHAVFVAYYDLGADAVDYQGLEGPTWDGKWSLVVAGSRDGGGHFGAGVVVDADVVPTARVMLVFTMPPATLTADRHRLCVAWSDGRNADADVFLRCSLDRGATWPGKAKRVNDDPLADGRDQLLPVVALSPQGRLDVMFYDRRADPGNILNDVVYAYSTDGGNHFAANLRLNATSFDSRIGQQYAVTSARGQVEFGSRLGLVSRRGGVLAVWTDTRNSNSFSTEQDLFSTGFDLQGGGFKPGSSATVAVGLLIVGLLTMAWGANRSSVRDESRGENPSEAERPPGDVPETTLSSANEERP